MKFDCGPDFSEYLEIERKKRLEMREWHKVFLWWPKRIASHDCRWLETVERRATNIDEKGYYKHSVFSLGNNYPRWEYRQVIQ